MHLITFDPPLSSTLKWTYCIQNVECLLLLEGGVFLNIPARPNLSRSAAPRIRFHSLLGEVRVKAISNSPDSLCFSILVDYVGILCPPPCLALFQQLQLCFHWSSSALFFFFAQLAASLISFLITAVHPTNLLKCGQVFFLQKDRCSWK